MNIKKITITILGATLLAGCASLEERLASNDPATKREAELELISQSRRSPNQGDRIAAINRVTDQEVLLVVATSAQGAYVPDGLAALAKLNGENTFVAVVNSAQNAQVRKAAFDKVNNQEVFEKLSVGASDPSIRVAAFDKLTSQEAILKIAGQSTDRTVRISAIDKVTDKSTLLPIVFKKVAAKPSVSKEEIQKAMMTIMRDRRMSEDEKKQKIAQLSAMAKGGELSIDNAVVDAFVAKCKDKDVLLKMIADYGEVLTTDQCAKIVSNNSSAELKSAVAKIADAKIYNEVSNYNKQHGDALEKYFDKAQAMSCGELKAKLVFEICRYQFTSGRTTKQCSALMESLDANGVVAVLDLISKQHEPEHGANKYRAGVAIGLFSTQAKAGALAYADKIDRNYLGQLLSSISDTKYAKDVFRQNPEWDSVDVYEAVTDSETAEYLLRHAKFNKLKKYSYWQSFVGSREVSVKEQLAKIVWHLVNQLDKNARERMLEESVVHLSSAKKDHVVFEKFYIGMPLLDYLLITVSDGLTWWGDRDYCAGNICSYSILREGDWRSSWTVSHFVFDQKERCRIFKTEGDLKGILAFVQKYCKRDADVRDLQLGTDLWWTFTDDAHKLKVSVHSKNGALNIYSF